MKSLLLALSSLLFVAGAPAPGLFVAGAPAPGPAPGAHARLPAGTWHVQGEDTIAWTAELVLFEEANAGYFDWLSARGDSGRELVTYFYDPASGTLDLTGSQVLAARGNITFGNYRARVVDNGRRLVDGRWWGPPCAPGVWEATR